MNASGLTGRIGSVVTAGEEDPGAGAGGSFTAALNQTALAALSVADLTSGERAFCSAGVLGVRSFVLMDAVSVAPDGIYIVATADDPTRQWVFGSLCSGGVASVFSPEIDLTAVGNTVCVPPITGFKFSPLSIPQFAITAKDGTVSVAPTLNVGFTSPNFADIATGQTPAAFASQLVNTRVFVSTVAAHPANADFSASGIVVRVTAGATLGTATQLKARLYYSLQLAVY